MRKIANIFWHVPFLGFINALLTFLIGGLFVITVIGAPIGLGLIQLSMFLLTPFSSTMINGSDIKTSQNKAWKAFGIIARILYFPFGLVLSILTVIQITGLFLTVLGIPLALVSTKSWGAFFNPVYKSLRTFFNPVNKITVDMAIADEVPSRKAKAKVDKAFES